MTIRGSYIDVELTLVYGMFEDRLEPVVLHVAAVVPLDLVAGPHRVIIDLLTTEHSRRRRRRSRHSQVRIVSLKPWKASDFM